MRPRLLFVCFGLAARLAVPPAQGAEQENNLWPVQVIQRDSEGTQRAWQGAGPFLFSQRLDDGGHARGFRPIWVARDDASGRRVESTFLYPLFFARSNDTTRGWSVLNLINHLEPQPGTTGDDATRGFDVWPFYFSRATGSPDTSYRALFPLAGEVRNRFYRERVSWLLFPLYLRTEVHGVVGQSYLWPFVRTASGGGVTRLAVWPLFGRRTKEGVSHESYYLWPFIYHNVTGLDQPAPTDALGVLPFYAHERSADVTSESFLWPFFGYTDRTAPYRYHETRYLWPFVVQGRGEDHRRNRWAPFYTHSVINGYDKQWILWPLFRRAQWAEDDLLRTETRVFWFLYRNETQGRVGHPEVHEAVKEHVWPLYSRWDNGAGRRQFQFLSPFASFFPNNENVRLGWTPLFALYRRDDRAPDDMRQSWLFDLVTWRRTGTEAEFHLGPLLGTVSAPGGKQVELAGGLVRLRRAAGGGWHAIWFDFSGKNSGSSAPAAR